jgi:Conserved hypothetical protein (DUF2461)
MKNFLREPLQSLVADLSIRLAKNKSPLCGDPAKALIRPYRDVRFSKDKSPSKKRSLTSVMIKTKNFEKIEVTSAAELRHWLDEHHTQKASDWLVIYKKHATDKYVSIDKILDELLCFGWIAGIARKWDDPVMCVVCRHAHA